MKGEIIVVGNELVSGRVQDVNSAFLCRMLYHNGFTVRSVKIIPDNEKLISEAFLVGVERSRFVIVTGGLGPTSDDKTVDAFARAFKVKLVRDPLTWSLLKDYVRKHGLKMLENVAKMADLPEGAKKLDSKTPRAGFSVKIKNTLFYFLPGIPEETKDLFSNAVLPDLLDKSGTKDVVVTRVIKVFGMPEAEIEERVSDIFSDRESVAVSFLPSFPEHHLHISLRGPERSKLEEILNDIVSLIERRIGNHIVAYDDETLESVVGNILRGKKRSLSVAESCTGGLIGHRVTNVSGASDYFERGIVVYSNRAKMEELGVPEGLLKRYGAVSEPVARKMAEGIREVSGSYYGLATTGIAGPTGGTPEKPVGTVYIALADVEQVIVKRFRFQGSRHRIKILTSEMALDILRRVLLEI